MTLPSNWKHITRCDYCGLTYAECEARNMAAAHEMDVVPLEYLQRRYREHISDTFLVDELVEAP